MNREENLCWFHGKIPRDRAEEILRQEGSDGVFMVRESTSSEGDFVLSVLFKGEVVHYQIRRHGDDAFFSIDDHTPIHGLDSLIEHYRQTSDGLVTQLKVICRNDPPPHDVRIHGTTNLLHRATKENNYIIVSELLKCGYRNFDAKNQFGQTAVHLACISAEPKVLELLIEKGANLSGRDSEGNTPLHYACRRPHRAGLDLVRILVEAGANMQARNKDTGWVPLHEAAAHDNLESIKELLVHHVPHMPRTVDGELPADIAKEAGHFDVVEYLTSYEPRPPITHKGLWYHGTLDRQHAVEILHGHADKLLKSGAIRDSRGENEQELSHNSENYNTVDGDQDPRPVQRRPPDASGVYLVRYSPKHGVDVLTLLFDNEAKHFIIHRMQNYLYIDDGPYLPSLEHLIEHYSRFSDGLQINLKYPVPPRPKPPIPTFATIPKVKPRTVVFPSNNSVSVTTPSPPAAAQGLSLGGRKYSDSIPPSNKPPHVGLGPRNFSVPNDAILAQMNQVGLAASPEQVVATANTANAPTPNNNTTTVNTTPKKKNIHMIIDGMKSLRKSKTNKQATKLPTVSSVNGVDQLGQQQQQHLPDPGARATFARSSPNIPQLSFGFDSLPSSGGSGIPRDEVYNIPTNNRAIYEIDIGEPPSVTVPLSATDSINNHSSFNSSTNSCSMMNISGDQLSLTHSFSRTNEISMKVPALAPDPVPKPEIPRKDSESQQLTPADEINDHFTLGDNAAACLDSSNCNEEIYFIDAPPTVAAPPCPQSPPVCPPQQSPSVPSENNNPPMRLTIGGGPRTGDYIATQNEIRHIFLDEQASPLSPPPVPPFRYGQQFERLESTTSRDSVQSGDSEYLAIIERQQEEDERLKRTSVARPNYFIPKECVVMQKVLGSGEFGYVYQGILTPNASYRRKLEGGPSTPTTPELTCPPECRPIAIKQLIESKENQGKRQRADFLREASVMIRLRHHCIVKLIGICKGPPLMMIEELVPLGSMLDFIIANTKSISPTLEIVIWASQIAKGMQYLEEQRFVHRDLAARNILLSSRYQAKISDFGLSRATGAGLDYYHASQGGKWPIKWYAPESFNFGTFSHASDVWSFGVTLWEMYSLGEPPYKDKKGAEVIELIEKGERLAQPESCPNEVFEVMSNCWNYTPRHRPTFKFLARYFSDDIGYQNLQELVQSGQEINANN